MAALEMVVESIRVSLVTYQRVVILKEKQADRYLPIWIGPAEADAIAIKLQNVPVQRPLTHDLLQMVLHELGGKVTQIIVNDLADDVFYARIVVDQNGRSLEIDSRPSDAIALAVRVSAPIFVEEAVLQKAGVKLGPEGTAPPPEEEAELSDAERSKLAPFRDFINTLDIDKLDKPDKPPERH